MKLQNLVRTALVGAFLLLISAASHAQATRTWVSGVGDDANPCSRTAPCKTFAGAISKTAAAGEISVLDPGGFGVVTITKSITLNGAGTLAGILSAGTTGIIVNAGVNDIVRIRDISIHGAGTGTNGIRFLAGKELHVERCEIEGITGIGIDVALGTTGRVFVADTNVKAAATGIKLASTSGAAKTTTATLQRVKIEGVTTGIWASDRSAVTIQECTINGSTADGVLASPATLVNGADVTVDHSTISFCGNALRTTDGATIRVAESILTANTLAVNATTNGPIVSYGDNRVDGNGGGEAFSNTIQPK